MARATQEKPKAPPRPAARPAPVAPPSPVAPAAAHPLTPRMLADQGQPNQAAGAARGAAAALRANRRDAPEEAAQLGALAGAAAQTTGPAQHAAKAVQAQAEGASLTEQIKQVDGTVPMSAGDFVRLKGAVRRESVGQDPSEGTEYHSPFPGITCAGIQTDARGADELDLIINNRTNGRANSQAVFAPAPHDSVLPNGEKLPMSALDAISDVAAVTQLAAATTDAVRLVPDASGKMVPEIDWNLLNGIEIQANLNFSSGGEMVPGSQTVSYGTPGQMAKAGYDEVRESIAASGGNPENLDQFIALDGHSGGGQSSFYTALKLASEGYTNISLVGLDMAMSPYQRQILEAYGVQVTNITSHSMTDTGTVDSEVGDVIRQGMGGGENYYDINVERRGLPENEGPTSGRHGVNDANVVTMMRYAQWLDSQGRHGEFTPENYAAFKEQMPGADKIKINGKTDTADEDLIGAPGQGGKWSDNRRRSSDPVATPEEFTTHLNEVATTILQQNGAGEYAPLAGVLVDNTGPLLSVAQQIGIDFSQMPSQEHLSAGNPSEHWGKIEPVELPPAFLPLWNAYLHGQQGQWSSAGWDALEGLWDGGQQMVDSMAESAFNQATEYATGTAENIGSGLQQGWQQMQETAGAIADTAGEGLEQAQEFAGDVGTQIRENAVGTWQNVQSKIEEVLPW